MCVCGCAFVCATMEERCTLCWAVIWCVDAAVMWKARVGVRVYAVYVTCFTMPFFSTGGGAGLAAAAGTLAALILRSVGQRCCSAELFCFHYGTVGKHTETGGKMIREKTVVNFT